MIVRRALPALLLSALLLAAPAQADDRAIRDSTVVYLASYPSEAKARAGWSRLAKASPILARQQPRLLSVDLGKKGVWVRLYALAGDEAERASLCRQLGQAGGRMRGAQPRMTPRPSRARQPCEH